MPTVLETWELLGCYLQQANYNDLNYGSSEVVTISLTIKFDNAIQVTGGLAFESNLAQRPSGTVTS